MYIERKWDKIMFIGVEREMKDDLFTIHRKRYIYLQALRNYHMIHDTLKFDT